MMSIISLLNILLIILIAISFHRRWEKQDKLLSLYKDMREILIHAARPLELMNKGLAHSYKIFILSLKTLDTLKDTAPLLPDDKKETLIKDIDELKTEMNEFLGGIEKLSKDK